MKPVDFDYARPAALKEAGVLLEQDGIVAKVVSGSQSLGPMLNLRLVQPGLLVDVTAIPDLRRVEETDDAVVLGACITHADIEDRRVPDPTRGIMAQVAAGIAYRAVRNRGTMGGSVSHADPAADWVTVLCTLGADILIYGQERRRAVPASNFVVGAFETVLAAEEIVEAVRIPRVSPRARWGYSKLCRKPGEFAHAMSAILLDPERQIARATLGATDSAPIVLPDLRDNWDDTVRQALRARNIEEPVEVQLHMAAFRRARAQVSGP